MTPRTVRLGPLTAPVLACHEIYLAGISTDDPHRPPMSLRAFAALNTPTGLRNLHACLAVAGPSSVTLDRYRAIGWA